MSDPATAPPPARSASNGTPKKQAVVLVHGMGQQIPMETLRSFIDSVWSLDGGIDAREAHDPPGKNPVWWKPDLRTGSLELSRITTRGGRAPDARMKGQRVDFYEFYWADCTATNTLEQLKNWFMPLLLRRRRDVPKDVLSAWCVLWVLTSVIVALFAWKGIASILGAQFAPPSYVLVTIAVLSAIIGFLTGPLLDTFGDVAHYVQAAPANITARREIRERGLALLQAISSSGDYDRIILVGHSLGSIIAYDLLRFFWSSHDVARTMSTGDNLHEACRACETVAVAFAAATAKKGQPGIDIDELRARYIAAQREVFAAIQSHAVETQQNREDAWLISDFITLGSPLCHAQFLLARVKKELDDAIAERRYPTSPPVLEDGKSFLYKPGKGTELQAHHAAPFAAVVWTNVYDKSKAILWGDFISGPVRPNFGPAIADVHVTMSDTKAWSPRFFTHTKYWTDLKDGGANLQALRSALGFLRAMKTKR